MKLSLKLLAAVLAACAVTRLPAAGRPSRQSTAWQAEVLPPEHRMIRDEQTGVDVLFITTNPAADHNFYFHERSFLSDGKMVLFYSSRPKGGLMGYLFRTGELVRLAGPNGGIGGATCARRGNRIFGVRGKQIIELTVRIEPSSDIARAPSKVTCSERLVGTLPEGMGTNTALNENSNETLLSAGVGLAQGGVGIATINTKTGQVKLICRMDSFAGHVEFSITNPYLVTYAGGPDRIWMVDIREGKPRSIHKQVKGEMVTHECWWVNDQLTFCGGYRDGESHVKVINVHSGEIRIIGAGAWWPEGSPSDLARLNWWHAAGDPTGRWVVADNWHGHIVIFDAKTTQGHLLAVGHRTYGRGYHPEPGWDWKGERLQFNSNMLGNTDVCVIYVPEHLRRPPVP